MTKRNAGISAREARWLAVDAQGLGRSRPTTRRVTAARLEALARSLGSVQLDAINVLERTQFLIPFSRLGTYDRTLLHQLTGPGRPLWEYWGHAASLQPVEDEPLFRWRYEVGGTYVPGPTVRARVDAWVAAHADYLAAVLEEVRTRGPLTAGQLTDPRRRDGEWWGRRSVGRQALEWLFSKGTLSAWRTPTFERVYDLPERVLPEAVRSQPTPTVEEAHRTLLLKAARAYGVGTVADLAGYYMLQLTPAKARITELVEAGDLLPVDVEGWDEVGYVVPGVRPRRPSRAEATLISPFDSLVWDRARVLRVFDFLYRIEVYVPERTRVHGYYVLPLLLGDELVGRVDLKADRRGSALRVAAAHIESTADRDAVAHAAIASLDAMREWLELERITVSSVGTLASPLGAALAR